MLTKNHLGHISRLIQKRADQIPAEFGLEDEEDIYQKRISDRKYNNLVNWGVNVAKKLE